MDAERDARTEAAVGRKSARLRERPVAEPHRRRMARPLAALGRRRSAREPRWSPARRRGALALLGAAALLAGALLPLADEVAVLTLGGGVGLTIRSMGLERLPHCARRVAETDGAVALLALRTAPLASGLVPGLALLPSIRWSLLAVPALALAVAATGLWLGLRWAPWVWRGACGAALAWAAHLGLGTLPLLIGPPDVAALTRATGALLAAASIAALAWSRAGQLERALGEGLEAEAATAATTRP